MTTSTELTAEDDDAIGPGRLIGEYRVEGKLGQGGMGTVFSAIHPVIAKQAAIKVLHPQLSVDREAVERFVQEARAVNQIGHPNIVDIFAFGTLPDGRSYFVMEWLRGQSLRERMSTSAIAAHGPIAIGEALLMLETVTVALEAAHDKGIVHRDLKPDNVFLVEVKGDRPTVKLLDFGIAKLTGADSALSQRTQTGNMMGTPAYMSPEQARGYAVDHHTDIYALGAVMFEILTGEHVFPADNSADMIAKHLYEPPRSARAQNPAVPVVLDALITKLLAKEAAERPTLAEARATMRLARQQVDATAFAVTSTYGTTPTSPQTAQGPTSTAFPSTSWRRSKLLVVGGLGALGALGLGVAIYLGLQGPPAGMVEGLPMPSLPPTAAPTPTPDPKPTPDPTPTPAAVGELGSATLPTPTSTPPTPTPPPTKPAKPTKPTNPTNPTKPTKPTKPT
ncbi:MAG: serine/threonine-protein kinase [Proteobacteria bacterium]|nr:serine/threonine-protein kinase [Pseudomonadota bacterium]